MARGRAAQHHDASPGALRLIPRNAEQRAITGLLLGEETCLVSLVGPPGAGKTRLAVMAAAELAPSFADGVVFVDLSVLQDPKLVGTAIAEELGMREVTPDGVLRRLVGTLRKKQVLLILDNFEHLLPAAPIVANLVAGCPRLRVLTTTREALHLKIERRFTVNPLSLPATDVESDLERLRAVPSVELFCLRAEAVESTWVLDSRNGHAVAELCRRLDGLPLAIELAAAWTGVLSPRAILNRLDRCLVTQAGFAADQPARHRTLSAAIGWSYELLDAEQKAFFDRLAIFVDGCDEEAAAAVGNVPLTDALATLASLTEKHLVSSTEVAADGEPRFRLLDTLKAFARSQLEPAQLADARRRHAEHYLMLAERAEAALIGPDQRTWLDRLERELGNLRAALAWAIEMHDSSRGLRLAAALWFFWDMRGHLREGQNWLESALRQDPATLDGERAAALNGAGWLALVQHGSYTQAIATLEEAQALASKIGDERRLVRAEGFLGLALALGTRETERAAGILGSAVEGARTLGDNWALALALYGQGHLALVQGDADGCQERWQTCAAVAQSVGNLYGLSYLQFRWGLIALLKSDLERANACLLESLRLSAELDSIREMAVAIAALVLAAAAAGEPQRATRLVGATQALLDRAGCDVPPFLREQYETCVATLRQRAGTDVFQQWVSEGQVMKPADIMIDAREQTGRTTQLDTVGGREPVLHAPLSAREWEIACLVALGLKNREIAERLVLTQRTIGSHLERMYGRLSIRSRVQLTAWVVEHDGGRGARDLDGANPQLGNRKPGEGTARRTAGQLRVVGD
jgi:non-specific serine/threonine protein kinase